MALAQMSGMNMRKKTIKIEHPLAQVIVHPRRPLPLHLYKKMNSSLEGVLSAVLFLAEEYDEDDDTPPESDS